MTGSPKIPVKLLVVDDLPENLVAMEALLEEPGVELLSARSGDEALELLLHHDVALALLDVQMPEMDGFELAELMRGAERTRRIPIIFVTAGLHDVARVFRGYDAGAVDFLFKPVDPRVLSNKVATFVELHRQRVQLSLQLEALRASEELRQRIIASSSDRLMLVDAVGNVTFLSATEAHAGGASERSQLGRLVPAHAGDDAACMWSALWDDDAAAARALAEARSGAGARFQCGARHDALRDGVWDVIVNPLHGARGQVERVVASARDVSEMVELHRRLSETLRLNETFVAAIGHDLRTPLNSIVLASDMLSEQTETPGPRGLVTRIRTSAQRMRGMIDELYDLARARLGGGIAIKVDAGVDLEDAAARVIGELDAQRDARAPIVLDARGNCRGAWDHARIMQVLSNLVGNALRHGAPSEPVRVWLDGSAPHSVQVTVENGGEIPADVRSSVFDPFKRGPQRTRSTDGLGLGLYIARQIVAAHGGSIALDSGAGRTAFRVELPRVAVASSVSEPSPLEAP